MVRKTYFLAKLLLTFCFNAGTISSEWSDSLVEKQVLCCECIPSTTCIHGVIDTKDQPTSNAKQCHKIGDVCCKTPDAEPPCITAKKELSISTVMAPHLTPSNRDIVCCECVPSSSCINGVIDTSGIGIINKRIRPSVNVEKCPAIGYTCCTVPNADPTCIIGNGSSTTAAVMPHLSEVAKKEPICCECVPDGSCINGIIDISGIGIINKRIRTTVNVEKCPKIGDVCCSPPFADPACTNIDDMLATTAIMSYAVEAKEIVCCECVPVAYCLNGVIDTSGIGTINKRIQPTVNVRYCPEPTEVCCMVPEAESSCFTKEPSKNNPSTVSSPTNPTFNGTSENSHPSCVCVPIYECKPSLIVGFSYDDNSPLKEQSKNCSLPIEVCCIISTNETSSVTGKQAKPTHQEKLCECVEEYLCNQQNSNTTNGMGIIDKRMKSRPLKRCPSNPDLVCCHKSDSDRYKNTTETPIQATEVTKKSFVCGKRHGKIIKSRIMGFSGDANMGEFPWMAAVIREINGSDGPIHVFVGGGSLIHPRVVLSAAHSLSKFKGEGIDVIYVSLGDWNLSNNNETAPSQLIKVKETVNHPKFNDINLNHDVTLLFLEEEEVLAEHITPICLSQKLAGSDASSCVTSGWGKDAADLALKGGTYQTKLKSVELSLVRNRNCQILLRRTELSPYFRLHPSFICAGGDEDKDSCEGDGGGPLSCKSKKDPSRYLQVGITSWGMGCGRKNIPGVYASIPKHYQWIMMIIELRINGSVSINNCCGDAKDKTKEERKQKKQERKERRKSNREERVTRRNERKERRKENRSERKQRGKENVN